MGRALKPAVFLDRDGTINVEKGYLFKREGFEYLPGVVDGLRKLAGMGFLLVIITNQSGIARGFYTEEDYKMLNEWILADLGSRSVEIAGTYYCPHHPEGIISKYAVRCSCRKPATGLFWQAGKELEIDMDRSFAVGDRLRDLAICRESGVRGLLLGSEESSKLQDDRIWCCGSFMEAVDTIRAVSKAINQDIISQPVL